MATSNSARRFLGTLWGRRAPGLIQLWELEGRRSTYLRAREQVDPWLGRTDVYVGVALADRDLGRYRRCRADQTHAIAGLWADIDINGGPERKTGAAPDMAQAMALAAELLEPTVLVNSGYGIQAWWCFDRPWVFAERALGGGCGSIEDGRLASGGRPADVNAPAKARSDAATMVAQWQKLLRELAREWGFGLDATHDLARLMRLPGTFNGKGGERAPVELIACSPDTRYPIDELRTRCAAAGDIAIDAEAPVGELPLVDVSKGRALSIEHLDALIDNSPEFKRTWLHARREAWSMSEYDLALCSLAARAGYTDQQLADLIFLHRRTYDPADPKALRPDYVRRTVAKARQQSERSQHLDWFKQQAKGREVAA